MSRVTLTHTFISAPRIEVNRNLSKWHSKSTEQNGSILARGTVNYILVYLRVMIEVEKVPQVIMITIIDMITTTGEEAGELLVEILTEHKATEILNINSKTDQIGPWEIRMVKAGYIIEVMIIKVNADAVGVVITIIGVNRIITKAEVEVGTCNQTMTSKASNIGPTVITVSIPNLNSNIMTSLDQHNHNKQSISVNCVTIKDTLTTNASLQVTLWP